MIRSFIQMTALILTLGASIFLLKANLGLTPENISKLSSTYWGHNTLVVKSFAQQSADTRVGAFLLISAFILQLVNSIWPMSWKDFGVNWHGILISVGICIVVLTATHWYSKNLSESLQKDTLKIFENQQKEEIKKGS